MPTREEPFSADALTDEEIQALKDKERRGRDRGARDYEAALRAAMSPFRYRAEDLTFLRHLRPRHFERVLDAGAGVGRQALLVAPMVERVVAVDFSEKALGALAAEAQHRKISNLETLAADLSQLPVGLGPFDCIYSVAVVSQIPSDRERVKVLRALQGMLRPGGRVLIEVPSWNRRTEVPKETVLANGMYHYCFAPDELAALLREAGFVSVRTRGMVLFPGRLAKGLPAWLAPLEAWASSTPFLAGAGRRLIGLGIKQLTQDMHAPFRHPRMEPEPSSTRDSTGWSCLVAPTT